MSPSGGGEEAGAAADVRQWLRERGAPAPRIADAEQRNQLHLLVADYMAVPEAPRYSAAEMSELTGLDPDQLQELWGSFGFPIGDRTDALYTQADVEAFTNVVGLCAAVGLSRTQAAALARVIGSATSRVAEAGLSSASVVYADVEPAERAQRFLLTADATLPGVARLLEYSWRRHFQAAARRALLAKAPPDGEMVELTVGFADLSGFTAFSHQLSGAALEELTSHFATVVHASAHDAGGRVVKMIGDEVMFVADEPATGVHLGLRLVEAVDADGLLSQVKVGIASGPVLSREGDYYGPAVNTANRIVGMTRAGSVVVTGDVRDALHPEQALKWRSLRLNYLRDIGWVQLWAVRPREPTRPRSVVRTSGPPGLLGVLDGWVRESLERMAALRGPVG